MSSDIPNFVFFRDLVRPTYEALVMKAAAEFKRYGYEISKPGKARAVFHYCARHVETMMGEEKWYVHRRHGFSDQLHFMPSNALDAFAIGNITEFYVSVCDTRCLEWVFGEGSWPDFVVDVISKHNMYYFMSQIKTTWMSAVMRVILYFS